MTKTNIQAMASKASASANKFSMVNPAQMCAKIAESVRNREIMVGHTSPTSFYRINPESKTTYQVYCKGGSFAKFATLDDAINYVNALDSNITFATIMIRPYGKHNYCNLADIWR